MRRMVGLNRPAQGPREAFVKYNKIIGPTGMVAFIALLAAPAPGCGGSSSGSSLTLAPLVPIVKSALPGGLVPGAVAAHQKDRGSAHDLTFSPSGPMTYAQTYITAFFQNYYPAVSSGNGPASDVQGWLLSQVTTIDNRASLYNGKSTSSHPCLSKGAVPKTLDYSFLNPTDTTSPNMLTFPLADVQCIAPFTTSGTSGSDTVSATTISGEVFGISGATTSQWVTVGDMAGDPINTGELTSIGMANLTNAGSTSASAPETVSGLSLDYNGSGSNPNANSFVLARYKAVPSLNTFELYFVSNEANIASFDAAGTGNGVFAGLGAGFRMISDGQYIYADGIECNDVGGTTCNVTSNWVPFQVCLSASASSSLAVVDPTATSDCLTLANSFTLSPNATSYTTSNTASNGVFAGLTAVTQDVMTFTNITGDSNLSDLQSTTIPSAAQLSSSEMTKLLAVYLVGYASSVTTTF